jgi:UDP-N-acetylmuramoyl-tripeptide--D-alanyl-D-alanine ligase
MNSFWIVIAIAWTVRILLNILSYIHLWYVKEYRFDRMGIHLSTPLGRKLLFIRWRRPPVTPKTIFIALGSGVLLFSIGWILPGHIVWKLLAVDILTFPIISVLVFLMKIPTFLYHEILIKKAVRKLRAHTPIIVVGITGSYAKTSTKEVLATLLAQKYKTLKTEASKNSPIAIAELVLKSLTPQHQAFIVEMGAYKKGEIAQMCQMVRPGIGIVTAINPQHQDLFGSIETTIEAKYELVQGLTEGSKAAIMNMDNAFVVSMAKRAHLDGKKVIGYSLTGGGDYVATNIQNEEDGISFTLTHDKKKYPLHVQLYGTHQASNVLAAIAAAHEAGMTMQEIVKATKHIRPFARTMVPRVGLAGARIIDDTYNNNPDAAMAAMAYLAGQPGRKIVVFQPMIELGEFATSSHEMVAKKMGETAEEIILTNESFADVFKKFAGGAHVSVLAPAAAASYLKKTITKNDILLFKGKEAGRVLQLMV